MKHAMLGLGLMLVVLACSFGMSLLVVEWRGADGEGEIRVDRQAEWVACQAKVGNQLNKEGGDGYLTSDAVRRIEDDCGITSDLWVWCVYTEMAGLPGEQLESFGTADITEIAQKCGQEVR
jgi:hypothetical protein